MHLNNAFRKNESTSRLICTTLNVENNFDNELSVSSLVRLFVYLFVCSSGEVLCGYGGMHGIRETGLAEGKSNSSVCITKGRGGTVKSYS